MSAGELGRGGLATWSDWWAAGEGREVGCGKGEEEKGMGQAGEDWAGKKREKEGERENVFFSFLKRTQMNSNQI